MPEALRFRIEEAALQRDGLIFAGDVRQIAGRLNGTRHNAPRSRPHPALGSPVTILGSCIPCDSPAAWVRLSKKAAMSCICASVKFGKAGIPFAARPLWMTGAISFRCPHRAAPGRNGPGWVPLAPPLALEPWQNPQVATKMPGRASRLPGRAVRRSRGSCAWPPG